MEDVISRAEHEEFRRACEAEHQAIKDENVRQNHRLEKVEAITQEIRDLALQMSETNQSVKLLAEEIKQQGQRLEALENRDGKKWRSAVSVIITAALTAIVGYLMAKFEIV